MTVTLIGYRGTGKSTVAPLVAAHWGWDWIDADAEIERRAGKSIRDIFAEGGEPAFRRLERAVMADLLQRDRSIVAAGGGAVLNGDTRREMIAAGPVVWLQASAETIAHRLSADGTTGTRRPNLTSRGGLQEIEELLAIREPLYRECATHVIQTDQLDAEEIAARILQLCGTAPEGTKE